MNEILTNSNFLLYAAKHYQNSTCLDVDEFQEDVDRIKYIKRLLNKYRDNKELKERLILNHLVVFFNMFGTGPGTRMLFLKLHGYESMLMPFLVFLQAMPDKILNINKEGVHLLSSDILMDEGIIKILRTV